LVFVDNRILLFALLPCVQGSLATNVKQRSQIEVDLRSGTLSVHISDMPLVDVLQKIGEESGFKLVVIGHGESRITRSFSDIPLVEGIHRLAGNCSVPNSTGFKQAATYPQIEKGSEAARAFLNTALQDKDAQVRNQARQALGYIGVSKKRQPHRRFFATTTYAAVLVSEH
jgi:hypothetical protein